MTETPQALVQDLRACIARMRNDGDEFVPERHGDRIRAVGEIPFFVEVFRQFTDSTLNSLMFELAPYWKDLPYASWRSIFRQISHERTLVYQFGWIASEFLALDVARLAASDPDIGDDVFREFLSQAQVVELHAGGDEWHAPRAGSKWFLDMFDELGIDNWAIWTRLAQEGAPMNIDISSHRRG